MDTSVASAAAIPAGLVPHFQEYDAAAMKNRLTLGADSHRSHLSRQAGAPKAPTDGIAPTYIGAADPGLTSPVLASSINQDSTRVKSARNQRFVLPLFSAEDPVIAELRALDVNALSPLAALNKLDGLQQRARE